MIAWLLAAPLVLLVVLLLAAYLETHIVEPDERAYAITYVLANGSADEVEREVSRLLRHVDQPRRRNA